MKRYPIMLNACALALSALIVASGASAQVQDPATGTITLATPSQASVQTAASAKTDKKDEPLFVLNVDNPAFQPFRANVGFTITTINTQQLVTTVPAGKRLVIEYISYLGTGSSSGTEIIYGALRISQFGPVVENFVINPPHKSATASLTLQDGTQSGIIYFEEGEEVWVSVSKSDGGFADIRVNLNGHFVDL